MSQILDQKDLLKLAGVGQKARLIRWLNKSGIRHGYNAKGEVWTTLDRINDSLDATDTIVFGHGQKS